MGLDTPANLQNSKAGVLIDTEGVLDQPEFGASPAMYAPFGARGLILEIDRRSGTANVGLVLEHRLGGVWYSPAAPWDFPLNLAASDFESKLWHGFDTDAGRDAALDALANVVERACVLGIWRARLVRSGGGTFDGFASFSYIF